MRRPAVLQLLQGFTSQTDAPVGSHAQQCHGFNGVARTAFTMKQHHRQVVLPERIAPLRSGPEVLPGFDSGHQRATPVRLAGGPNPGPEWAMPRVVRLGR